MNIKKEILLADKRIIKHIRETPLEHSEFLSKMCKCNVYLKLESEQVTGSFKIRGALNKLLSLSKTQKSRGIVTASTGNHGLAVAYGLKKLSMNGEIFLPENASPSKIEAIRAYESNITLYGRDSGATEIYARQFAEKSGKVYVSPYNDLQIVGGQGTIGIELCKQLSEMDTILVPVGGGGLISGIAAFVKELKQDVDFVGCQPTASPVMYESIKAGKTINMPSKDTISDGTAGGIESNAITFDLCKKYVNEFILIDEKEIRNAIYTILDKHHKIIEGAAALPAAALIKERNRFKGKNVVLVISGSNISPEKIKDIIEKH